MMTTALFWIIGIFVAIVVTTFTISLAFGRKLSVDRPLDPLRDQLAIVQNGQYYKRRLLNGEEFRIFRKLEDYAAIKALFA